MLTHGVSTFEPFKKMEFNSHLFMGYEFNYDLVLSNIMNEYLNEYINGTSQRDILTHHQVRIYSLLFLYSCI